MVLNFQFFLLNEVKRILQSRSSHFLMNHRTYATLTPNATPHATEHGAHPVYDAEYHLALALRCVETFILEEFDIEDNYAALEAIAEMQAQADLPGAEP